MSKRGWEIAAKVIPIAGLGKEEAIAPPTSAWAVAVILLVYQSSSNTESSVNIWRMYPILFNIGPLTVSSFGVFLALSLSFGSFTIWRLAQVYDLDREKIIDLILITFLVGLIGARIFYIVFNLSELTSIEKMFFINKYPGFSLWGGIISGLGALLFFAKRFKFNFWLIFDFAIVGFFAASFTSSFGCIFSGCMYGFQSNLFFSIPIVGVLGDRFPIQIFFGIFYFIFFAILWKRALKFHFQGAIFSLGLIFFGAINFILGFFRGGEDILLFGLSLNSYFSLASILLGVRLYYFLGKRSLRKDLGKFSATLIQKEDRARSLLKLKRSWYNLLVQFRITFTRSVKKVGKRLNVKENPREF